MWRLRRVIVLVLYVLFVAFAAVSSALALFGGGFRTRNCRADLEGVQKPSGSQKEATMHITSDRRRAAQACLPVCNELFTFSASCFRSTNSNIGGVPCLR